MLDHKKQPRTQKTYKNSPWECFIQEWTSDALKTRYKTKAVIGEGSFGCVFKSIDRQTQIAYALKKVNIPDGSESIRKSMLQEYKILKKLDHPNIIRLIEIFHDEE